MVSRSARRLVFLVVAASCLIALTFPGAAGEAPPLSFSDATVAAGLANPNACWGAAWADFDGDGWEDLAVAVSNETLATCRLYRNRRDGSFGDVSYLLPLPLGYARSVVWADYNRDGRPDLFISFEQGGNRLLENRDGVFVDVTAAAGVSDRRRSRGAAWADYDRDGWPDLYVCNYGQMNALYHNNGDGTFTDMAPSLSVGEDGKRSESASWGDMDGDGFPDLFVCNDVERSSLFRNNGDGTFTDVTPALGPQLGGSNRAAAWGDYDNDGRLDLFVTVWTGWGWRGGNLLFHNDGDGSFTERADAAGVAGAPLNHGNGATWGDFDNDGDLDLYVANDGNQPNALYLNVGNGAFTDVASLAGSAYAAESHDVAAADYDHDGRLDLYVTTHLQTLAAPANRNVLYRNTSDPRHWVQVTGALGDTVVVATARGSQTRWIGAGHGYLGHNAGVAHFGLGAYDGPVTVSIAPSNLRDRPSEVTHLLPDRRYSVPYGYTEPVSLDAPLEVQAGERIDLSWALWNPNMQYTPGSEPPRLLWDLVSHTDPGTYPGQRLGAPGWATSGATQLIAPNYPSIVYAVGAVQIRDPHGALVWVFSREKPIFVRGLKVLSDLFALEMPAVTATGQPFAVNWGPRPGLDGWKAQWPPTPYVMWDTVPHPGDLNYRYRADAGGDSTATWFAYPLMAPESPTTLYVRGAVYMAAPYTADWFFTEEKAVRIAVPVGSPLVAVQAPERVEAFDPYPVTWRLSGDAELIEPPSPILVWDTAPHPFDVDYPYRAVGSASDGGYIATLNAPWRLGTVYMRGALFLRTGGEARWFYSEETAITISPPIRRTREGMR